MNIRELAEHDLAMTLEDSVNGFGWDIIITDPDGKTDTLQGQAGDIGFQIDPDTGQAVSGRQAHCALRISTLEAAGFDIPVKISDKTKNVWKFEINDINGNPFTYTVAEIPPDRTLGIVNILLEFYKDG